MTTPFPRIFEGGASYAVDGLQQVLNQTGQTSIPVWQPNTAYTAPFIVVNPSGQLVNRITAGTSGATYDSTQWTVVNDTGAGSAVDLSGYATQAQLGTKASRLTPTSPATGKTGAYTAAVRDLAIMNVSGGGTALTLPTAPADGSLVGYVALGATIGAPLTVSAGGSDTIGYAAAASVSVPVANEATAYQYDAANTRWIAVGNVKPLTGLVTYFSTLFAPIAVTPTPDATKFWRGDGTWGTPAGGSGPDRGTQILSVTSYGAVGDGTTDCTAAFQAALAAAKALVTLSGQNVAIYVPSGKWRLIIQSGTALFTWGSQISLIGAGRAVTHLAAESAAGATLAGNFIQANSASAAAPYTDCTFSGFELDMENVLTAASYNAGYGKGFFIQYMRRAEFSGLYVHGAKATGIGTDFLVDSRITGNIVANCGNFTVAVSPGDSGIGIGTGGSADEYVVIGHNTVIGNRNHGIFIEKQGNTASNYAHGFNIVGNNVRGNYIGIADRGGQGAIIADNQCNDNVQVGIAVATPQAGTATGNDGFETRILDNVCNRNGTPGGNAASGINVNNASTHGRIKISGNQVAYNYGFGVQGDFTGSTAPSTAPVPGIWVTDNDIHDNYNYGVTFGPTSNYGYINDLHITDNRIFNNYANGIRIKVNATRMHIGRNKGWDDQTARTVTDGVLNSTTTVTSATAAFTNADVGKVITGAGIPAGTRIQGYTNATTILLTQPASSTASGVSVTIGQAATQTIGCVAYAGITLTDPVIEGNDFRGCATPWTITAAFAGTPVVRNNPGLDGQGGIFGAAFALPASATPWTNQTGTDGTLYVSAAGTTTAVSVSGTAVPIAAFVAGAGYRVKAGGKFQATYSAAPTLTYVPD